VNCGDGMGASCELMEITLGLDTRTDSTWNLFHSQNGFPTRPDFPSLDAALRSVIP